MMNEKQRLTYLNHLGIDNYVARRPLKGAAPSVVPPTSLDSSIPTEQEIITELVKVKSPVEDRKLQEKPEIVSYSASTSSVSTEAEVDNIGTASGESGASLKSQSETIRFALNCWRISDDLLALDSREPGAALPTDTLLLNIVRSIGYPMEQLPQSELLRWPLFSHDQNANDEHQARAMVHAYVQAQASKKPAKYLFLMGTAAARFTLEGFNDWQNVEGKTFQQWQMNLIVIPSLADMLREPLLKRVTWEAIKSLGQEIYVTNNNLMR